MLKLNNNLIDEIILSCEQRELNVAWFHAEELGDSFGERRAVFLLILQKLLESGKFRLKNRETQQVLQGTIQEQIKLFDLAMPKTGAEIDTPLLKDLSSHPDLASEAGTGVLMQYWFFDEECPGDPSWLVEVSEGVSEWS